MCESGGRRGGEKEGAHEVSGRESGRDDSRCHSRSEGQVVSRERVGVVALAPILSQRRACFTHSSPLVPQVLQMLMSMMMMVMMGQTERIG